MVQGVKVRAQRGTEDRINASAAMRGGSGGELCWMVVVSFEEEWRDPVTDHQHSGPKGAQEGPVTGAGERSFLL